MAMEQRIVHFSGMVQGVGFRYAACRVAGGFAVTGCVRNLPDGRVECLVEGQAGEIDAFLEALRRQMEGYISGEQQVSLPASGRYRVFGVRS